MEQKKGTPVWIWLLLLVPVGFVFLGVVSALAIYGVRKYVANAKEAEAHAALVDWGDGLAKCGEKEGGLPPSTLPVPASISAVTGKKYQSAPNEWSQQAHICAAFSMTGPQYFQYRWERRSASAGVLHAVADLNGDAVLDSVLELDVSCGAGKCERGVPNKLAGPASGIAASGSVSVGVTADSATGAAAPTVPTVDTPLDKVLVALSILCLLANFAGSVWLLVLAFQESVVWGLSCLFVPCVQLVFVAKFWQRTKRAFLFTLGTGGAMVAILLMWAQRARSDVSVAAASDSVPALAASGAAAHANAGPGVKLAPPPPYVPVPELTGAPVDLSTVMGKARKLANQWDQDAALVGIETTLVAGVIPTQDGASARLTFGPSIFKSVQAKTGLFVVTYDKSGISGAAAKGPPAKAVPEPMCAPERVYARLAESEQSSVWLRYGFDSSERVAWMGLVSGQPVAQTRFFDPQSCEPIGLVVGPRRR
jgi:type IV pilus assembly protein PilA